MRFLSPPRRPDPVLLVSDLPAWGRVALASGAAVLERAGIQACCLPTALLSSHGGYPGVAVAPQTDFLRRAVAHLEGIAPRFAALATGFVAEPGQYDIIIPLAERVRAAGGLVLVDPIMGDHGRLYGFFGPDHAGRMRGLAARADLITPNLTEAAVLLGLPADAEPRDQTELQEWLSGLCALGPAGAVITSAPVPGHPGRTGVAVLDRPSGRFALLAQHKLDPSYPGTGDHFAAGLLVELLCGRPLPAAARRAAEATHRALRVSIKAGGDPRAGLVRL